MFFDAIFLTLFFLIWAAMGALPWLGWSLRRRAEGALWALPFALLGGAGGGALVPLAGMDNAVGVGVSMAVAPAAGLLLTGASYAVWDAYRLDWRFQPFAVRAEAMPKRPILPAADASTSPGVSHTTATVDVRVGVWRPQKPGLPAGRHGPPSIDSNEPSAERPDEPPRRTH